MNKIFDYDLAIEYIGIPDLFFKLKREFVKNYKSFDRILVRLLNKGNFEELKRKIHSLKGITLNLGCEKLYDASIKVENEIINNDLSCFYDYINIFKRTYDELKKK